MVAVIGPKWLGPKDDGTRRIDEERDWIRVEIEIATHLGIPIIPVLVERAPMPGTHQVPEGMREVTMLNALVIEPGPDFHNQVRRLTDSIDRVPIDEAPAGKVEVDHPPVAKPMAFVSEPPLRPPVHQPAPDKPRIAEPMPRPRWRKVIRRLLVPFEFSSSDSTGVNIAKSFGAMLVYATYVVLIAAIGLAYLVLGM
jgi:hypothetical protein